MVAVPPGETASVSGKKRIFRLHHAERVLCVTQKARTTRDSSHHVDVMEENADIEGVGDLQSGGTVAPPQKLAKKRLKTVLSLGAVAAVRFKSIERRPLRMIQVVRKRGKHFRKIYDCLIGPLASWRNLFNARDLASKTAVGDELSSYVA